MILFQYIIEILHRPMPTVLIQSALGFELYDGRRISSVLVGVDNPRGRMVLPVQRFGEKALGSDGVALGRKEEVDSCAGGVHGTVLNSPLPLTRM